jgi:CPA1 family monovalent cation:H+ antiporter
MFTVPHLVAGLGGRGWSEIEPWQDRLVLGWCGMRGALSLAAALSIPGSVAHREEILFLTFTTILATLVVLAIPLPYLLERLGFTAEGEHEVEARIKVAEAALQRLEQLEGEQWATGDAVDGLEQFYRRRVEQLSASTDDADEHVRLRRELLAAERAELQRLERAGEISFGVAREIERRLDLEEAALSRR